MPNYQHVLFYTRPGGRTGWFDLSRIKYAYRWWANGSCIAEIITHDGEIIELIDHNHQITCAKETFYTTGDKTQHEN